jgi:plastocyanin
MESNNLSTNNKKNNFIFYFLILCIVVLIIAISWLLISTKPKPKTITKVYPSTNQSNKSNQSIKPVNVQISSNGFDPSTLTVKVGQFIVWTNNDTTQHAIISDKDKKGNQLSSLNSPGLNPTDQFGYSFTKAGTYSYHDNLSSADFRGVVKVTN